MLKVKQMRSLHSLHMHMCGNRPWGVKSFFCSLAARRVRQAGTALVLL
jgi:hypothetical protein